MEKRIDFSKIEIKDIENNSITLDVRKPLGNSIYMQGQNIEERDLGRAIYYSDGEVTLTDTQIESVKRFVSMYPYITREAIYELLK